jgi:hypothetical protein
MKMLGALSKMQTMHENPVRYMLDLGDDMIAMNSLIGRSMSVHFTGKHICFCGFEVERVFRNNFCFDCFLTKPEAGAAIFNPELSKAHLGIADRDLEFEQRYQMQPHVVYLANSGGLKVGVTRARQKDTRWMDQGASSAIVLAETENRFEAGKIEVFLKNHLSDKTHWSRMLTNAMPDADLKSEKARVFNLLPEELKAMVSGDDFVYEFAYPVQKFPPKVQSINLSKNKSFAAILAGIRGQYLIFNTGQVFNVRSHEGYLVELDVF